MKRLTVIALTFLCAGRALAQLAAPLVQWQPTPPISLPVSGRTAETGSATSTTTPVPGATTSVNTINSSVQVQGPFSGSASSIARMPFSGKLSFHEALRRGLEFNLGAVGLANTLRQARGQQKNTHASLLPTLNTSLRENYLIQDLQALGVRSPFIPKVVGPFNYFDLRATLTQTLGDMSAINNYRSAKALTASDEQLLKDARDIVVLAVGGAYLQVIAAQARIDSANAQLETAKAVYRQTFQSREAGLSAQIDVNRALVQQQTQEQRLATMRNDLSRQKINLARLTGIPANDQYELAEDIGYSPGPALDPSAAVELALHDRADLIALAALSAAFALLSCGLGSAAAALAHRAATSVKANPQEPRRKRDSDSSIENLMGIQFLTERSTGGT